MSLYTALLDANVLYPAPMRDILMELAVGDLYKARWTDDIHREWINSLLRNEPERSRERLERTRDLMNEHTRDCLIYGYECIIPSLELPDPNDRHVLAAAIVGRCDVIVTQNIKDFPAEVLSIFNIETQHPDEFLLNHLDLAPGLFCEAIKEIRSRLKNPPYDIEQYLQILRQRGLVATAAELEQYKGLI